jgi:hypothetical protein
VHRVAEIRTKFFGLLDKYHALNGGYGWLVYGDKAEGIAAYGPRQVLLLSKLIDATGLSDHSVPQVRIVANELVACGEREGCLTEDATIAQDGRAAYLMTAFSSRSENTNVRRQELMRTLAPIFLISKGQLHVSANTGLCTPNLPAGLAPNGDMIRPYGGYQDDRDNWYALDKASEIIDSVSEKAPMASYKF